MSPYVSNQKRIVFVIESALHFHYFSSIIEALLRRGAYVCILFDEQMEANEPVLSAFAAPWGDACVYTRAIDLPRVWGNTIFLSRTLLTYRRFLRAKDQSDFYRARFSRNLPPVLLRFCESRGGRAILASTFAGWLLRTLERIAPSEEAIRLDIRRRHPDVVVCTPVNREIVGADVDYLKAARALGIPTALPVISWDNLSTKGVISIVPTRLLVWNTTQREEAIVHQEMPPAAIRIVGASMFDVWFDTIRERASTPREQFCAAHGLDPALPILLYLGSSQNIAPDESWLVAALIRALRASDDPAVARTQVVIREHPGNRAMDRELARAGGAFFIPERGAAPKDRAGVELFADTLAHAGAVIGVNTSGMIDAIIAGRPTIALISEQYRATQQATEHFRQLLLHDVVEQAASPEAVPDLFARLISGGDERKAKRCRFIEEFIRPHGLSVSAGERAASEILTLIPTKS